MSGGCACEICVFPCAPCAVPEGTRWHQHAPCATQPRSSHSHPADQVCRDGRCTAAPAPMTATRVTLALLCAHAPEGIAHRASAAAARLARRRLFLRTSAMRPGVRAFFFCLVAHTLWRHFERGRQRMGKRLWFIILESRQRLDDVHQDQIRHGAASGAALQALLLFGCVAVSCVRHAGSQECARGGHDMDECRVQSAIGMERSRASIRSTRRKGMHSVSLCRCLPVLTTTARPVRSL